MLAEGSSDRPLISVLERLCARRLGIGHIEIEWANEHLARHGSGRSLTAKITTLLEIDPGYDVLFVHRDADARDPTERLTEIDQAFKLIKSPPYVRVVPVQETEAWLLVDESAIREHLGIPSDPPLDLPKLKHIERRANPKELLKELLSRATTSRRASKVKMLSERRFNELRAQLLESLDVDGPVCQLSAWQQLVADINRALDPLCTSSPNAS